MPNLPKRKHIGCDPMCDECVNWMFRLQKAIEPTVEEALKAFWVKVEELEPECSTFPLGEGDLEDLNDFALQTAATWAMENLAVEDAPESLVSRMKEKAKRLSGKGGFVLVK